MLSSLQVLIIFKDQFYDLIYFFESYILKDDSLIEVILFALTAFAVGLSGALVPGPMFTVTISNSLKNGFIAGPLIVVGHFLVEIVVMIIIIAGLGWLLGSNFAVFVIGTLGGLMMIFIGYRTIVSSDIFIDLDKDKAPSKSYGPVLDGVLTSLSNPFFFIWWATIGWAFMLKGFELAGLLGFFAFLVGHWTSDMGWFSTVSYLTSRGSRVMTGNHYKLIITVSGLFLVILGIYFVLNAMHIV